MSYLKTVLLSVAMLLLPLLTLNAADDVWPEWPTVDQFSAGQSTQFRMPFFKNYYTYPNNEPLFFTLYLPQGFDPERRYPLAIQYQGQNSPPGHWVLRQMTGDEAIILGVSWSMSAPTQGQGLKLRDTGAYHIPACVHWLTSNFKIDRERILVGGFSAGGWSASSQAMRPQYRNISTHFVITGAGVRGRPVYSLFQGKKVFIASGTNDMNYDWSLKAKNTLTAQKFDVTYFQEEGVDHKLGPKMKVEMAKWFAALNPKENAEEWLQRAETIMSAKKPDVEAACVLLADVACLGPNNEFGKKARQRLEEIEGDALFMCERAWEMLSEKKYGLAMSAFKDAGKAAKKIKSKRLVKLCLRGLAEIPERQMVEQVCLLDQCEFNDRPYQSYMLCHDGVKRLSKQMKDFGGDIFKNNFDWYEDIMKKMKKPPKARLKAQKELVSLRLSIWSGKAVKNERETEKTREKLQGILDDVGDAPEKREAEELLLQLPAVEQFDVFGNNVKK